MGALRHSANLENREKPPHNSPTNSDLSNAPTFPRDEKVVSLEEERYRHLLMGIFENFATYKLTRKQRYLDRATNRAKELDERLSDYGTDTIPIGIFHSAGSGLEVAPLGMIRALLKQFPRADLYGYQRLSHATAEFSVAANEHLHRMRLKAEAIVPDQRNPDLDALLRQAYIPTPNLIHGMAAVGPIRMDKEASSQFQSWVKGPLLHDRLGSAKKRGFKDLISQLHHHELWAVSQKTGVWQAYPYVPEGEQKPDLEAIVAFVKSYYLDLGTNSVREYVRFVDLPVSEEILTRALGVVEAIARGLVVSAEPLRGNIGRYFDAALRNYISEVGDLGATDVEILNRVYKRGDFNYDAIWDITRRIDLKHAHRLWGIFEEDIAHVIENCNVEATPEQKEEYQAATTLTRLALSHFRAFEEGDKNARNVAIGVAEELSALHNGGATPSEIKTFAEYRKRYESTFGIMPWLRKLRQGVLALVYLAKAYAYDNRHSGKVDLFMDEDVIPKLVSEAEHYVARAIVELPEALDAARIKQGTPVYQDRGALTDLLEGVRDEVSVFGFSESYLFETGKRYLDTLR